MLGNKINLTLDQRSDYDRKIQSTLALLYIVLVFTYSIAIVLISYQEYIDIKDDFTYQYNQMIVAWQKTPINHIQIQSSSYQLYANISGTIADNFQLPNLTAIAFTYDRISTFNFLEQYSLLPYCANNKKLCGGADHSTKLCIDQGMQCPLNMLKIYDLSKPYSVSDYDDFQYNNSQTILIGSTFYSEMSIIDLRYGYNGKVCESNLEFEICSREGLNYVQIEKMSAIDFYSINGLDSSKLSNTDTVGLFYQQYIDLNISCRDTMIERIQESPQYYKDISYVLYIQTVGALVYCIVIGLVVNIIHFLLLSDFQFILLLPEQDQKTLKFIRKLLVGLRFLTFIPYGICICYLYFMEAQMHDTLFRVLKEQCIDQQFEYIIAENVEMIKSIRKQQSAIFWIFIVALIIELLSIFIILYRSVNLKKKNLIQQQYENELEINHDEVQKTFVDNTIKQKDKPMIRPSFTPNEQQRIRQSVAGVFEQQIKNNQEDDIIDEQIEQEDEQYGYFKPQQQQQKETSRPVWNPSQVSEQRPHQSPMNNQKQYKF